MKIEFEPTNSFCYRFARYVALPEILREPNVVSGEEFHLITAAHTVIDRHLSAEQLIQKFVRKKSRAEAAIGHTIRFYIPFLAKNLGLLVGLGAGIYRLPATDDISDEVLEEAELEGEIAAEDESLDDGTSGTVYAYSFPLLMNGTVSFPIKIGKATGDVEERVKFQVRRTASFESAQILGTWQTQRVSAMEYAIHNILKVRGRWRDQAPGTEWFNTTVKEIDEIVQFIEGGAKQPKPDRAGQDQHDSDLIAGEKPMLEMPLEYRREMRSHVSRTTTQSKSYLDRIYGPDSG